MLGPLEVTDRHGRPLELAGARLRALLILLALEPGRVVNAERLIDGVWGDDRPSGETNALQSLISRLRRAVPGLMIESRPTGYRLDLDPGSVDVVAFERLVAEGRARLAHDADGAETLLAEALDLWRGPALVDVSDADFARGPIARLTELRVGVVEENPAGADPSVLAELVAEHPLRERLRAQYMRALYAAGRQADALATYEDARRTLAESLGVDPSAELASVHVAVLQRSLPQSRSFTTPTPAKAAKLARTNLRTRLTSFIGREEEVRRVVKLLAENRLVTLTGAGGAGKTRLAVESGFGLVDEVPDGVWMVELAPVGDPAEVPQAALAAIGLREALISGVRGVVAATGSPIERLVAGLAGKRLLIILDNCEHLIDAAARLADRVLAECPGVRFLTTSREGLGITGEVLWPVPPLAFPAIGAPCEPERIEYPAVRLFVERGTAVRPDFAVGEVNLSSVAVICRRLDGIPLAIELAAARLRTMSAQEIADRLDDRFRLLTGGSRTALPRHQTLRAVVDWSWDLLDDDEHTLLRRLSVFAGGATLESIERVCDGDILDALTGLVEKSLVTTDGLGRYRLLETIRAYGGERLAEAGESPAIRAAHARHFLALAEEAEPMLRGGDQVTWLRRLVSEHDNLHAAARWSVDSGDAALSMSFVAALGWYWFLRGKQGEGWQLAEEAFLLPGEVPVRTHAVALGFSALNTFMSGVIYDIEKVMSRISTVAEMTDGLDPETLHPLIRILPISAAVFENPTDIALLDLTSLRTAGDPWVRAAVMVISGHGLMNVGRVADAEADLEAGREAFGSVGDRWGMSLALIGLADLATWCGDHDLARSMIEDALAHTRELETTGYAAQLQVRLAQELSLLGDKDGARDQLEEALAAAEQSGTMDDVVYVHYTRGESARREGDLDTARHHLELAGAVADQHVRAPQWRALLAYALGLVDAGEGQVDPARTRFVEALELARSTHDGPIIAQILTGFSDLEVRRGDFDEAALLLGAAVGVRGTEDKSLPEPPRLEQAVRKAIGDDRFQKMFARGQAMNVDDVTSRVVGHLDRGT